MNVLALDLALSTSGVALPSGKAMTIETDKLGGVERLAYVRRILGNIVDEWTPDVVAIEGYAFSAHSNRVYQIGELGGVVRMLLYDKLTPFIVVPPTSLKKFAVGKGSGKGTDKVAMFVAAQNQLGYTGTSYDESDALWLWALTLALTNEWQVSRTKTREAVLAALSLPESVRLWAS